MAKVQYVGPHDGVEVEDVTAGFSGTVEQGEELNCPAEVAERLLEQGDNWKTVGSKPKSKSSKTSGEQPGEDK